MGWLPTTPLHPIEVLVVLATSVKNYLKWQAIQLAIHSTVGEEIDYACMHMHACICLPSQDTVFQIITIGISKYL